MHASVHLPHFGFWMIITKLLGSRNFQLGTPHTLGGRHTHFNFQTAILDFEASEIMKVPPCNSSLHYKYIISSKKGILAVFSILMMLISNFAKTTQ